VLGLRSPSFLAGGGVVHDVREGVAVVGEVIDRLKRLDAEQNPDTSDYVNCNYARAGLASSKLVWVTWARHDERMRRR
jgi:hypothetical protein